MESVKYILGKPEVIQEAGEIFPIKVKDYDEFNDCRNVLYINKNHFSNEYQEYPLLDLIVYGYKDVEMIRQLKLLIKLVTGYDPQLHEDKNGCSFIISGDKKVYSGNYDSFRRIVMRQNLLFEQKVYKNKLTQEWANKAIEAKSKNGIPITFEDMITTVSVITGKTYDQIGEQTIYQLTADFKRIARDKSYHTSIAMKCAGAEKVSIEHFAEEINMFENPYDNLFVGKDNLNNLNKALKK
ncbi:hypothetical protein PC41400_08065 [Paenibacillus chitinolyticus]|uniref:Uncharacterized protein n=1 Tax=Paenibacillus chitinolyticus TaxID=79263 RepID=A0A410WTH2_9BACL|nr:hypothetical protein [Paenibacillus chitinolyticus]MCY9594033.1 hypothetical protein [Paenibacillus chitinolyticus]MCY9599138.1 hypothetical protein [Paenibacillus chitinolyticus]QAV17621.1 hypothetical protein PC41400_08065 [Paenibacillus chitinolyticus]